MHPRGMASPPSRQIARDACGEVPGGGRGGWKCCPGGGRGGVQSAGTSDAKLPPQADLLAMCLSRYSSPRNDLLHSPHFHIPRLSCTLSASTPAYMSPLMSRGHPAGTSYLTPSIFGHRYSSSTHRTFAVSPGGHLQGDAGEVLLVRADPCQLRPQAKRPPSGARSGVGHLDCISTTAGCGSRNGVTAPAGRKPSWMRSTRAAHPPTGMPERDPIIPLYPFSRQKSSIHNTISPRGVSGSVEQAGVERNAFISPPP